MPEKWKESNFSGSEAIKQSESIQYATPFCFIYNGRILYKVITFIYLYTLMKSTYTYTSHSAPDEYKIVINVFFNREKRFTQPYHLYHGNYSITWRRSLWIYHEECRHISHVSYYKTAFLSWIYRKSISFCNILASVLSLSFLNMAVYLYNKINEYWYHGSFQWTIFRIPTNSTCMYQYDI